MQDPFNTPFGFCHCGCGQLAPIAPRTDTRRGFGKGIPRQFINGHKRSKSRRTQFGDAVPFKISDQKTDCQHYVVRKIRRGDPYPFNAYVCGNCAKVFEVKEYVEVGPPEEPMFDGRKPWGLRDRQA
jgi:hypothetical protein